MKKKEKRKYPFPRPDEKRNRELRDARIISATIRTKPPVDARDIGNSQSAYNREVNNAARKSFQDIDKLRSEVDFINNLPQFKERKTASIKALTRRLINTPFQRWTPTQMEKFKGLGSKLKEEILRRKEKKGN